MMRNVCHRFWLAVLLLSRPLATDIGCVWHFLLSTRLWCDEVPVFDQFWLTSCEFVSRCKRLMVFCVTYRCSLWIHWQALLRISALPSQSSSHSTDSCLISSSPARYDYPLARYTTSPVFTTGHTHTSTWPVVRPKLKYFDCFCYCFCFKLANDVPKRNLSTSQITTTTSTPI